MQHIHTFERPKTCHVYIVYGTYIETLVTSANAHPFIARLYDIRYINVNT